MPVYAAISRSRKRSAERKLSLSSCSSESSSMSGSEIDIKGGRDCDLCGLSLKSVKEHYVCGHNFHIDCVWRWAKRSAITNYDHCPVCRIYASPRAIRNY